MYIRTLKISLRVRKVVDKSKKESLVHKNRAFVLKVLLRNINGRNFLRIHVWVWRNFSNFASVCEKT